MNKFNTGDIVQHRFRGDIYLLLDSSYRNSTSLILTDTGLSYRIYDEYYVLVSSGRQSTPDSETSKASQE